LNVEHYNFGYRPPTGFVPAWPPVTFTPPKPMHNNFGYDPKGLGAPILGAAATAEQIASSGAGLTTAMLVAFSVIPGPIGAAVGALIGLASTIASMFGGCGQTCIQASNIANQVEPALQQNLKEYLAAPVHYASLQKAALNNFDTAWSALTQACGNPQLQTAGQNCIADRQQGACHYKTSQGGWNNGTYTYPGTSGSGSTCWNWFVGYRDPIANDPTVVPDPVRSSASSSGVTSATGTSVSNVAGISPALLIGGALLVLAMLL